MSRIVIVEQKGSRQGRKKTTTRGIEHELRNSERAQVGNSQRNEHPKQSSLILETFKPRTSE